MSNRNFPSSEQVLTRINYDQYKKAQPEIPIPKIQKPRKKEQGVKLQPPMDKILENQFTFILLGRPGSGKTSVLSQLLTRQQFYGHKFGRILYMTPSHIPGIQHDKINTCNSLDFQWLDLKLKQYSNTCRNVLLVIDDLISDIPSDQRSRLKSVFYDRRHILGPNSCLSIIVTSQKYTCIPKWLRVVADMFLTFSVQMAQLRSISAQLNTSKDIKTLTNLFRNLQKHQFIYFNLQKSQVYNHQFYQI